MISLTTTYDLVAIGSGPAGQRAAVQAAKLGKRAAVVEREPVVGGVSTNTGTLPSKTLRAAIVELTGQRPRRVRQRLPALKEEITIGDLLWRTRQVIEHEREVIHDQLRRNRVAVLTGSASFVDPHHPGDPPATGRPRGRRARGDRGGHHPGAPRRRGLRRPHRARLRRHPAPGAICRAPSRSWAAA